MTERELVEKLKDRPLQYAIARGVRPILIKAVPDAVFILGAYMVKKSMYVPRLAAVHNWDQHSEQTAGWVYFWEDRMTARSFISEGFPEENTDCSVYYSDPRMEENICAAMKEIWADFVSAI